MSNLLQFLLTGMVTGSVYGLVALGFVLIYKCSSVFNLAQGALLMFGAYFSWSMLEQVGLPVWLAVLATMVFACFVGLGLERFPLRPLFGQPILALVMVTIALLALLEGVVDLIWGWGGWKAFPRVFPSSPISVSGASISHQHVYIFSICMAFLIAFTLFFRFTKIGLRMRAIAEDQRLARSAGISVNSSIAMTWLLASVSAMLGGFFLAQLLGIHLGLSHIGLKAVPAALIGGLQSLPGAIMGGLIIGIVESLVAGYVGFGAKEIAAFVILILVLVVRPYGLFGLKRIERI